VLPAGSCARRKHQPRAGGARQRAGAQRRAGTDADAHRRVALEAAALRGVPDPVAHLRPEQIQTTRSQQAGRPARTCVSGAGGQHGLQPTKGLQRRRCKNPAAAGVCQVRHCRGTRGSPSSRSRLACSTQTHRDCKEIAGTVSRAVRLDRPPAGVSRTPAGSADPTRVAQPAFRGRRCEKASWSLAIGAFGAEPVQTRGGVPAAAVPGQRNSSTVRVSVHSGCTALAETARPM